MVDCSPSPPNSISNDGNGKQRQSAIRSSTKTKPPLPRYTSIDLENEIPEIYNTSLNPNIHDPDMTMFFNRNSPPFHTNYAKRHSPPPSYSSKNGSSTSTSSKKLSKPVEFNSRRNVLIGLFLCIFIAAPIFFLITFYMIPRIILIDRPISLRN